VLISRVALSDTANGALTSIDLTGVVILLAFLLVFKVQSSYDQYWNANYHVHALRQKLDTAVRNAFFIYDFQEGSTSHHLIVRFIRFQLLYFSVVAEYFYSSGPSASTMTQKDKDRMRGLVRKHLRPEEEAWLYSSMDGALSPLGPSIVFAWMAIVVKKIHQEGSSKTEEMMMALELIKDMEDHFEQMDLIDKLQFPLPYSQMVKLMMIAYMSIMPFILAPQAGFASVGIMLFIAVGLFGLDEVAEILECPFGKDPNDIDLWAHVSNLEESVGLMCQMRKDMVETALNNLTLTELKCEGSATKAIRHSRSIKTAWTPVMIAD
jgi:predicted membrane chloride channel (bestrophin family)